jgi:hypothetical protein
LGTIILGGVGGFFLANLIRLAGRRMAPRSEVFDMLQHFDRVFKGFIMAAGVTEGYFVATDRYNELVCHRFLDKYLEEAKDNGFENY